MHAEPILWALGESRGALSGQQNFHVLLGGSGMHCGGVPRPQGQTTDSYFDFPPLTFTFQNHVLVLKEDGGCQILHPPGVSVVGFPAPLTEHTLLHGGFPDGVYPSLRR